MRWNPMEATGRGLEALGWSRVFSALLAAFLAGSFLVRGVDAQGSSPGAGSDLECTSLGGWATFAGVQVPGVCVWNWNLKGNRSNSNFCGPRSPAVCYSTTSAASTAWATGMHIRAEGYAQSILCPATNQCVSSITSHGTLTLVYGGPASPPCGPRVRVEWSPQWNFALAVDPPAAAVVAGGMSGRTQYTRVVVKAVNGATLNSLSTLLPVQLGPVSIPVAFAGNEGHFVKQVADSMSGDVATEIEKVDWLGEIHVGVQSEISALNWTSESALRVCHSDPDLTIYAYCTQCSGGAWIEYRTNN